jgi:hypothetical protein
MKQLPKVITGCIWCPYNVEKTHIEARGPVTALTCRITGARIEDRWSIPESCRLEDVDNG